MALIECRACGKKISDTTEKCIHCGSLTKEPEVEKIEETTITPPKARDYNQISDYERNALEMEFIRQDEEAMKYKVMQNDRLRFKKLRASAWPIWLLSFLFSVKAFEEAGITTYTSGFAFSLALLFNGLILLLIISITIYLSFTKKAEKTSSKRFVYLKKYQCWLLNEKKIEYTPVFVTEKEKILFEKTYINV